MSRQPTVTGSQQGARWYDVAAPGNWADRAACKDVDMSLPHKGRPEHINRAADRVRWVCLGCEVLGQCREWALSEPDPAYDHVAAGMTPQERKMERRHARPNTTPRG